MSPVSNFSRAEYALIHLLWQLLRMYLRRSTRAARERKAAAWRRKRGLPPTTGAHPKISSRVTLQCLPRLLMSPRGVPPYLLKRRSTNLRYALVPADSGNSLAIQTMLHNRDMVPIYPTRLGAWARSCTSGATVPAQWRPLLTWLEHLQANSRRRPKIQLRTEGAMEAAARLAMRLHVGFVRNGKVHE